MREGNKYWPLVICLISLVVVSGAALAQQATPAPPDPEMKRIREMALQARAEGNKFREAGGKPGDVNDPARKWAAVFWKYREEHLGTPAATTATYVAIAWLLFSHQYDEVIAKAEKLPADDPAWARTVDYLLDAARLMRDPAYFINKANSLIRETHDKKLRASVQMALGRAYLNQGQPVKAKAAFQAVVQEMPDSDLAAAAQAHIYEITRLMVGQATPRFDAKAIDGSLVSSDGLRGKVVLLNFWVTW